ncbi:hypothetical protein NL393_36770, partial [Klebsiella pneumoniae]|nr:hypothetical protein [Klebsiella pneumoniae]
LIIILFLSATSTTLLLWHAMALIDGYLRRVAVSVLEMRDRYSGAQVSSSSKKHIYSQSLFLIISDTS